jgi:membrane protein YdbS with pleckstrin-like domain
MRKIQLAGTLMIVVGAVILIFLAGFIASVIVTLAKLLLVVVGIILVLGGVAALFIGPSLWKRRPFG